ncbi:MAG: Cu(I)-responsive transcriptional regulator, partial [Alcaligenes aquatilis]
ALLLDMAAKLRVLAEQCQGDHQPDCPILDGLEGACCHTDTLANVDSHEPARRNANRGKF